MTRINIQEPLAEICERLGLTASDVRSFAVRNGTATAVVYLPHPDHGGKFIGEDGEAAVETHTFQVRT